MATIDLSYLGSPYPARSPAGGEASIYMANALAASENESRVREITERWVAAVNQAIRGDPLQAARQTLAPFGAIVYIDIGFEATRRSLEEMRNAGGRYELDRGIWRPSISSPPKTELPRDIQENNSKGLHPWMYPAVWETWFNWVTAAQTVLGKLERKEYVNPIWNCYAKLREELVATVDGKRGAAKAAGSDRALAAYGWDDSIEFAGADKLGRAFELNAMDNVAVNALFLTATLLQNRSSPKSVQGWQRTLLRQGTEITIPFALMARNVWKRHRREFEQYAVTTELTSSRHLVSRLTDSGLIMLQGHRDSSVETAQLCNGIVPVDVNKYHWNPAAAHVARSFRTVENKVMKSRSRRLSPVVSAQDLFWFHLVATMPLVAEHSRGVVVPKFIRGYCDDGVDLSSVFAANPDLHLERASMSVATEGASSAP